MCDVTTTNCVSPCTMVLGCQCGFVGMCCSYLSFIVRLTHYSCVASFSSSSSSHPSLPIFYPSLRTWMSLALLQENRRLCAQGSGEAFAGPRQDCR